MGISITIRGLICFFLVNQISYAVHSSDPELDVHLFNRLTFSSSKKIHGLKDLHSFHQLLKNCSPTPQIKHLTIIFLPKDPVKGVQKSFQGTVSVLKPSLKHLTLKGLSQRNFVDILKTTSECLLEELIFENLHLSRLTHTHFYYLKN